jgi:hypothetical protein
VHKMSSSATAESEGGRQPPISIPFGMEIEHGSSSPEDNNIYVVYHCAHGHSTPVYVYEKSEKKIVHHGRCAFAVPHIAKERMDWKVASVNKPVAVWFAGGNGKLPWMSMLRACDASFVGFDCVLQDKSEVLEVSFPDSDEAADDVVI